MVSFSKASYGSASHYIMHSLAIIWTTASLLHGVGDKLQVIQNTAMHVEWWWQLGSLNTPSGATRTALVVNPSTYEDQAGDEHVQCLNGPKSLSEDYEQEPSIVRRWYLRSVDIGPSENNQKMYFNTKASVNVDACATCCDLDHWPPKAN